MSKDRTRYRVLFAGGGTGGHLFPAVAVAEQIKIMKPETEILFIGTKSKIEGRVVPQLGYKFKSIWIKGFARKFNLENLLFPLKLFISVIQSIVINMNFRSQVAVGSGGYVSGPAIFGASVMGAKILLLEQNSYPGVTTRLLERYADEVHISFDDSKKFLRRKEIIKTTGNPVRMNLGKIEKEKALEKFELNNNLKTMLVIGGSLGAESINKAVAENITELEKDELQIIWQTGKNYFNDFKHLSSEKVKVFEFIEDMNSAYSACDMILARAGATTIAEILVLGIPAILVPSPNVAENHQYYNAKSLADNEAAVLIEDKNIADELYESVKKLILSSNELNKLRENALKLAKPDAAKIIAERAIKLMEIR